MQTARPSAAARASVPGRTFASLLVLAMAAAGLAGDAPLPVRDAHDAIRAALPPPDSDAFLGVVLDEHSGRPVVASVVGGSAAESAGLLPGDVLESLDATPIPTAFDLERALRERGAGQGVRLTVERARREVTLRATLGVRKRPDECFRGSRFELAVVPLRFADDAGSVSDAAHLTKLLFTKAGAEGPGASLADYYRTQSGGRLDVSGRVFEPVALREPRTKYASQPMGGSTDSAFAAAVAVLAARPATSLRGFDGIAFLYGGEPETRPGFALWPHRGSVTVGDRRIPYYVHATNGADADTIGVHCHEFGHLLGLPDAYGAGHVTGCGDFCVMAIGHRGGGRSGSRSPFSMCAWCKLRLAWIDPVCVDPRTPQRLRLEPAATAYRDVLLVPMSPRTEEYLLLEVRRRDGFDAELPSPGLLVWHVGGATPPGRGVYGNYVELVAAHGLDVLDAALVRTSEIAFPTARARDLTPETRPAIVGSAAGACTVHLTDIERAAGGAVWLTLGVPRRVVQAAPVPEPAASADAEGFVVRTDPVTGREVRLFAGAAGAGAPALPLPAGRGERR